MIKTAEHIIQTSSPSRSRTHEKLLREWKRLSFAVLAYILVVVIAAVAGSCGKYDLSGDSIVGFALWFLLLPGYFSVCLLGFVSWCFDFALPWEGNQAWLLGACDIVQILLLYALVSWRAFATRKPSMLDTFRNFVRILIYWGIFQLGCCAVRGVWTHGGISDLHKSQTTSAVTPDQQ